MVNFCGLWWHLCHFLMILADYGVDKYDIGSGFGHFGIAVEDVSVNWISFCFLVHMLKCQSQDVNLLLLNEWSSLDFMLLSKESLWWITLQFISLRMGLGKHIFKENLWFSFIFRTFAAWHFITSGLHPLSKIMMHWRLKTITGSVTNFVYGRLLVTYLC